MTRFAALTLAILAATPATPAPPAEPPPAPGVVVLGPALTPPPASPADAPVVVPAGRFLPLTPADGSPSYIAPSAGYRVYRVPPGGSFTGVKWDADPDAEPEVYSWPSEKGPIYVLLARGRAGRYPVQMVKNGPADSGPVENGSAILVQIGPRPPPPPPVPPTPPVPPGPLPDGAMGLQRASRDGLAKVTVADKATQAMKLAAAQRSVQSALAAGAYNSQAQAGQQALAAAVLADRRASNNAAVKAADWMAWSQVVDPQLSAAYQAGRLKVPSEWQAALEEIALGLEGR